jgi:transcription termination/antitermination protein NusA
MARLIRRSLSSAPYNRKLAINSRFVDTPDDIAALFVTVLKVDSATAQALIAEGFGSIEEVAYVPVNEWENVRGIEKSLIPTLRANARDHLNREALEAERRILGESGGIDG